MKKILVLISVLVSLIFISCDAVYLNDFEDVETSKYENIENNNEDKENEIIGYETFTLCETYNKSLYTDEITYKLYNTRNQLCRITNILNLDINGVDIRFSSLNEEENANELNAVRLAVKEVNGKIIITKVIGNFLIQSATLSDNEMTIVIFKN